MGFTRFTRIAAGFAVAAQIIVMLVLVSIVSLPQSVARASEPDIQLPASDIPLQDVSAESTAQALPDTGNVFDSANDSAEPDGDLGQSAAYLPAAESPERIDYQAYPQGMYTPDELRVQGVIYDGGHRYTWYSQRVLPGGGLDIEGRHVSDDGYVVDAQERIVVASSDLAKGTEIDIPFGGGKAIVLDTGCISGTIDVYTDF